MKLGKYLSINSETVEAFATRAKVPEQTIYKYLQEEKEPGSGRKPRVGGKNLQRISVATGNQVTVYDYYDIPPLPAARKGANRTDGKQPGTGIVSSP